jgi:hypothetical protein
VKHYIEVKYTNQEIDLVEINNPLSQAELLRLLEGGGTHWFSIGTPSGHLTISKEKVISMQYITE